MSDYGRDETGRYTGSPQQLPRHEIEGESQATIGEWSDALLFRGRDVLTDGTLLSNDPATTLIRLMVGSHRAKKHVDLMREVNKRMAAFRGDGVRIHRDVVGDYVPKGGW